MKKCRNCGKYFIPFQVRMDETGVHPTGRDFCSIECTDAFYGLRGKGGKLRRGYHHGGRKTDEK